MSRFARGSERGVRARFVEALALAVVAIALAAAHPARAATDEEDARKAARLFGQALTSGQASMLRPILPDGGKVHLAASRLVPEEGYFGASQVEALLGDFLSQGSVRSFELLRLESDGKTNALVQARAVATDRQGRPARLGIHLAFQAEQNRWVLREIKETLQ